MTIVVIIIMEKLQYYKIQGFNFKNSDGHKLDRYKESLISVTCKNGENVY